jgi:sulfite reductase beta subunit-like hemoprotein
MASGPIDVVFPCNAVPRGVTPARLIGLYPQRDLADAGQGSGDLWMQRIKVPGGRLDAPQWRVLARAARDLTPGTPMHLTTRQDIEFHSVRGETVPVLQRVLANSDMSSVGAGGDTLRNITVCPCSGAMAGSVDLLPLALSVRAALEREPGILHLPRKFKIAFCCSGACGQPWINDLSFVAGGRDGRLAFRVIGAGSLGASPATGIVLFDRIEAGDAVPVALAAIRLFAKHGDREDRRRARLRYVRQRLGDDGFLRLLHEEFDKTRHEQGRQATRGPGAVGDNHAELKLTFPNGDVEPDAAEAIADLIDQGFAVRIANNHTVRIFGPDPDQLARAVAGRAPLAEPGRPQPSVVACPGTRWCSRAVTDTNAPAYAIRARLRDDCPARLAICVSGCPNGCAHSRVADIGLVGTKATVNGRKVDVYDVFAHGQMGRTPVLAQPVALRLPTEEAVDMVARLAITGTDGKRTG